MMKTEKLAGRGLALGAMLGIGYASVLVVRDAMGSIYSVPALQLMEQWQQQRYAAQAAAVAEASRTGRADDPASNAALIAQVIEETPFSPDPGDWEIARASLDRAIALAPGNPELHANRGRLYQFRFEDRNLQLDAIREGAETALGSFTEAARLRPTWPYHWWDIARTGYVLQRTFSPQFYQALDNTSRFGPWLNDVQLFAADLALEHWDTLAPDSRALALDNIDRALVRSPEIVTGIVAEYAAWEPVCDAGPGSGRDYLQLNDYCASAELRSGASARELEAAER